MDYDFEFIQEVVKGLESEKRYNHTLGVQKEAYKLGTIFLPEKAEKLSLAGLLHDITKDFTLQKQLELCKEYCIPVDTNNIVPKLLHSKTGCEYAKHLFGDLIDNEIYNSIYYHTTGRKNMTLFEIIIYLVYAIKFLKHLIGSTTAASRYRPLVEKNIFILGTKDNKKDSLFLFILLEFLRIIVRGGWLWLAIIIYITLAYPFNVLLNYNIIGMFENVGGISEVIEIISNFHSAIMENELINKLPLLLAGILFCLFYFMHLHKEMVKRNNPKFTAILDLD